MSIRHGLLALLNTGEKYGYQLRAEFEQATGSTWPLNIGQVYTTLNRLERDGLIEGIEADDAGRVRYRITEDGRNDLRTWLETPVSRQPRPRDELAIKLAVAITIPGTDVQRLVQTQRTATYRALQEYTRLKRTAGPDDLSWTLVMDSLIFNAEAEIRWLDHCEARLARRAAETAARGTDSTAVPSAADVAAPDAATSAITSASAEPRQ